MEREREERKTTEHVLRLFCEWPDLYVLHQHTHTHTLFNATKQQFQNKCLVQYLPTNSGVHCTAHRESLMFIVYVHNTVLFRCTQPKVVHSVSTKLYNIGIFFVSCSH